MDIQKYRKWYLEENWGQNRFIKVKIETDIRKNISIIHHNGFMFSNHPLVLSGKAYWINVYELCVGYELAENPEIYRPIFSHKRQILLDRMHKFTFRYDENGAKTNEEEEGYTIDNPYKFWNRVKTKYFKELYKIKKLPLGCVYNIIMFIH
jgi:hypothetical protein